jgi:ribonuclease HII
MAYRAFNRTRDLASNEEIFRVGSIRLIAGADEAGRGALAGPLAAAAVMFAPGVVIKGIDDSKQLLPQKREELYVEIIARAEYVSVAFVDPGLIDRWGVQLVNYKALGDAVAGLGGRCECVVCDHFALPGVGCPSYGIPKADETFQSVAAASIVAKVERDRVMTSLHGRTPFYNFEKNKGYATEEHLTALAIYGPSQFHRMTFHGVLFEELDANLWED